MTDLERLEHELGPALAALRSYAGEADTSVDVSEEQVAQRVEEELRGFRERLTPTEYEAALVQSGIGTPDEHRRMLTEQLRSQMLRSALEQYLSQTQQLQPIPPT